MKKVFFCALLCALLTATLGNLCVASEKEAFMLNIQRMVEEQIERRGITDRGVLDAMRKVERHLFVPAYLRNAAYEDRPLPIGHGQTISQPYIVAYMTQAARVGSNDRILEIGTGSGYQAAVLAEIAKEIYTIEILQPLADSARLRLEEMGYKNVKVKLGDGYKGWREYAPFDAIIVTAAPSEIPEELMSQLKIGGRMVVPIGIFNQELYLITRAESGFTKEAILPVAFVPMIHPSEADKIKGK
ncbi:MAG: protein-L-isoaspartate(D-aspartate) O-methyltransferase [Candidatus Omnitrophica bacterium]|nr:protein-L-isoaspartate(D-aspartate) O-methyltransferase [Candidatus Omnitrophota bacterium]MCG2714171.1 protein-L-isoaspartate(D-aspartate) O-methyltransferase [Candidatus Omnitrophota bacterium]